MAERLEGAGGEAGGMVEETVGMERAAVEVDGEGSGGDGGGCGVVVVRAEAWMVVQATEAALAGVGWVAKMAEAAMVWGRRWWWRRETGRGWRQGDGDWVKGQGSYGGGEGDGGGGDVAAERGKQHVRQTLAAVKAKQMEELQKVASAGGGDEDQGVKAPHMKRAPKTIASRLGRGSTLQRPGRRVTARQRKRAPKTRASRHGTAEEARSEDQGVASVGKPTASEEGAEKLVRTGGEGLSGEGGGDLGGGGLGGGGEGSAAGGDEGGGERGGDSGDDGGGDGDGNGGDEVRVAGVMLGGEGGGGEGGSSEGGCGVKAVAT
eukprot:CAMPEP_0174754456 /NCGR_PEP_ID=MMETSP1094-20130205/105746_1 /TAXON_ID=156173 /ORGANISM="Chrysochromulina brevifilum, Strain UTEX LB 985" /LENGTH=319 /DNA_ID=CAMNT_0015960327 /DNA_START=501 /DNA_END=1461 /DNA_ORIENTATION=+